MMTFPVYALKNIYIMYRTTETLVKTMSVPLKACLSAPHETLDGFDVENCQF